MFVFYLTFASARIAVIGLKASLEMGLACLNHFPLFAVMLRLKDPGRLPGGICFELQDTGDMSVDKQDASGLAPTAYVLLKVSLMSDILLYPYLQVTVCTAVTPRNVPTIL